MEQVNSFKRPKDRRQRDQQDRREDDFVEKIVQINRVSKKTKGGNKISFSVVMVVGDQKGKVGLGLGKAQDVAGSIKKAATRARKHLLTVPLTGRTISREIRIKRGAAKIILRPAAPGTGVIAGGAVRSVVEAAGIHDILSKILGSSNKVSNVYATFKALEELKRQELIYNRRIDKKKITAKEN